MVEKQGTVRNARGIHLRPSGLLRKAVDGYAGTVEVIGPDGTTANPHSVLSIISLALVQGETFTVRVKGENEEDECNKILNLLESTFEFEK